jgi:hypothetical protein
MAKRTDSVAELAKVVDQRRHRKVRARMDRRATWNSRRMWLLVVLVWMLAAGILFTKVFGGA